MHHTTTSEKPASKSAKKLPHVLLRVPKKAFGWIEQETLKRYSRPSSRLLVQHLFARYLQSCLYSPDHAIRINQRLIDTAYSARTRMKVVELLRDCPFIEIAENYSTGRATSPTKSTKYRLVGLDLKPNPKHPKSSDDINKPQKLSAQDKSALSESAQHRTAGGGSEGGLVEDRERVPFWACKCVVVPVGGEEFERQQQAEEDAREKLGWNVTRDYVAESICRLKWDFDTEFERDLYLADWIDRKANRKQAEAAVDGEEFDRSKYVTELSRNIERAVDAIDKKQVSIKYRHGRFYHDLNSFPAALRSKLLIETKDGELEYLSEADLSGSFHVVVGSSADHGGKNRNMIRDFLSGDYYERLGAAAEEFGYTLPREHDGSVSRGQLKKEIQIHCLFNEWSKGFTLHPLWRAFERLYPMAAKRVIYWRKLPFGATRLSRFLSEQEGLLFVEHVIPELMRRGIPVVSNHDGVLVPESRQAEVKAIVEHFAELQFGFNAEVKTKPTRPESITEPGLDQAA